MQITFSFERIISWVIFRARRAKKNYQILLFSFIMRACDLNLLKALFYPQLP
jgi:hypothetical protein